MNSYRAREFHRLMRLADDQPSKWLLGALRDPQRMSVLSRAACLRVLACRERSTGLPYLDRKRLVKALVCVKS